ncbi:MAG: DUF1365 domain-containing protein [Pseudomonadota bacterium]
MNPVAHEFCYRLFMMYLDLAEVDTVFDGRWFWSTKGRALARYRREDHLGNATEDLAGCVRALVHSESGYRPEGPIRLLTHLQYFGYVFNPVSFYYCFDQEDTRVEAIVAEVNNTPWGERHCYVLCDESERSGAHQRFTPVKRMHVSPFMQMDVDYDWRFRAPDERLTVHMENARGGEKVFDATLDLERREISAASLAGALASHPFMTGKVIGAIHWQALKLWLKGSPVHVHPDKAAALERSS